MIMEAIFRGNLSLDTLSYPHNPEYQDVNIRVGEKILQIKELLGPENAILMDTILKDIYTAQLIESEACFKAGLAIGVKLQKEVEQELDNIIE